tara:strand:- start:23816 stop:24739 length:924 start_codon:yes stop_codon:yes gene_type:complete
MFYISFEILFNVGNEILDYKSLIYKVYNYILIFIFSWTFLRISSRLKDHLLNEQMKKNKLLAIESSEISKEKFKTTSIEAAFKVLNFFIVLITGLAIFYQFSSSLGGILAFGSFSGIIFGIASKDLLGNFFGGIMVYFTRPFDIDDWIKSPDREIEGFVKEIGWFTTKVITFDKRPLYLPNAIFTNISLENPSRMTNRKIRESIRLRLEDLSKVPHLCKEIKNMLIEHNGIDENEFVIVNLDKFNESYIEIFIHCFTRTIDFESYHSIKQDILMRSYKIINDNGAEVALNVQEIQFIKNYKNSTTKE